MNQAAWFRQRACALRDSILNQICGASGIREQRLTLREQKRNMDACPSRPNSPRHPPPIWTAAEQAIAACGGDPREAIKALLVAVDFLEAQADEPRAAVSCGLHARSLRRAARPQGVTAMDVTLRCRRRRRPARARR